MSARSQADPSAAHRGAREPASSPPESLASASAVDAVSDPALDELRRILTLPHVEPVAERVEALDSPGGRVALVRKALPGALRDADPAITSALAPAVEHALVASVKKNRGALSEVLFPIMGPAIRRSIRDALEGLVDSINRTLEHSLTPRGLRWRLEAWRTGRPFGEVVLRHSLVYRVEQVFLVDPRAGLLIEHASALGVRAVEPALVSAMLTAITDFARDSFQVGEGESVRELHIGALELLIAPGPHAVLAAVVRGAPPPELRERLDATVEDLHGSFADELADFDGDPAPLAGVVPALEACLVDQRRAAKKSGVRWIAPALLLLVVLGALAFVGWRAQSARRALAEERAATAAAWDRFADGIDELAGVVVADARMDVTPPRFLVLVDPSVDFSAEDAASGAPGDANVRVVPHVSLEPEFVTRRVRAVLNPPASVSVAFADGVVQLSGVAPHAWATRAPWAVRGVPGVSEVDASALAVAEEGEFDRLCERFGDRLLTYLPGEALPLGGATELERMAQGLDAASRAIGARVHVHVVGRSDDAGTTRTRLRISEARAASVAALLVEAAPGLRVSHEGVGDTAPLPATAEEDYGSRNRSVAFAMTCERP